MVQVDDSISYDPNMKPNQSGAENWSDSVNEAVAAFARQVGESSQQLAAAAERFARESVRALDEASRKAETSAAKSSEAAGVAGAAAAEARELSSAVQTALAEAADRVRAESSALFQDAIRQAETAMQSSRQMTLELQDKLDAALRQIDSSVNASRDFAAQASGAAQEARQVVSDSSSGQTIAGSVAEAAAETARAAANEVIALRQAVAGAERNAEEARQVAQEARDAVSNGSTAGTSMAEAAAAAARSAAEEIASLREAVAGAERAAEEARQAAMEATAQAQQPALPAGSQVSAGAQEVLERLEADYSLLTKLVQELHARIASLSTHTAPVYQFTPPARQQLDAEDQTDENSGASFPEPYSTVESVPEPEASPSWEEPSAAATESWNASGYTAEASDENRAMDRQHESGDTATISGRVLVSISPVPDFDRLLSLDGALGRMSGIGNVTLADYAREEVTFRVEVDPPTSVEDFRSRLAVSAGASIEVVASGDEGLALRLAS